jgi:molecular chaperone IbpA
MTALFPSLDQFHKSFDPFAIGFDDIISQMKTIADQAAKNAPSYPPYNIRQVKDNKYVIEMAVAGFAKSDVEVTLDGNKLIIQGKTQETDDKDYLYKGIANRNFQRTFTLADKVEIKDAEIANGMLKVWLENMVKAQDMVKKITVKSKNE